VVPETGGMFSGITNWFGGVKNSVTNKIGAVVEAISPTTLKVSGAIDGFVGGIGRWLSELPAGLGKGFTWLGSQVSRIAKALGNMAAPITVFLSGLEAWEDYMGWKKGDITGGEFAKRLTGNVTSTVAAWLASGAVTTAVATSGLFTAGTTTLLAPAAGVATFMGTQAGTRFLSDKIFDMFGIGDGSGSRPTAPATPVNQNRSTTPGVPVSSIDPRLPVIENAKAQALANAEQSKNTAELLKQQLAAQAMQKSSTETLASIDKSMKDMAALTTAGNEQRGKNVRYNQHIAIAAG
jgi:hypothetical protein